MGKLFNDETKQYIYEFALAETKKDKNEFPAIEFNEGMTTFTIKSINSDKNVGVGDIVGDLMDDQVTVLIKSVDHNYFQTKKPLVDIIKERSQLVAAYKKDFKKELTQELMEEKEQGEYKVDFKQALIRHISKDNPKEKVKTEEKKTDEEKKAEEAKKEEQRKEQEQCQKRMKDFEEKHGFDAIYRLRKEVIEEVKEMDLTIGQREKLEFLEANLEKLKETYDKNNTRDTEKSQQQPKKSGLLDKLRLGKER